MASCDRLDVVVGWEYISHHVYEDDGVVEVCATVYTADNVECPISFSFNIMTTLDPNEGRYLPFSVSVCSSNSSLNFFT